ncbi:MAG: M55 family metallopeptidase [Acidobacteria bacterium]|nr:M55 family metallopeptidase [Acidobacteriota bacterium]
MRQNLALLLLVAALPAFAQAPPVKKKTIFIISDAEGVAGVCHQFQIEPKGTDMPELLHGEVNAAVQGFFDGGADEVIVVDGHYQGYNLSATKIHPRARLILGPLPKNLTFDKKYTALAFVGQHAMGNVQHAIMAHSFSSLGIQNMKVNGKPVGEIGIWTEIAGEYGTPVLFLSGDQAAADEVRAIEPNVTTAVVKTAIGRNTCDTMSAVAARERIAAKAMESMSKLGAVKPRPLQGPVTLELEYTTRNSLPADSANWPNTKVVDDRTIQFFGPTLLDAWTLYRGLR